MFGYRSERPDVEDELQGVRARFMTGSGPRIELVCNLANSTVLSHWLRKGTKFYHIAFEVDDLEIAGAGLSAVGAKQVVPPLPGIAFEMRMLTFYALPNMVLVELISRR